MSTTISQTTSRVRNQIKAVKQDPFLTDRYLYQLILKYAQLLIKRVEGSRNQMNKFNTLFVTLPCMDLITVSKTEACCGKVKTECIIKRTKVKIPNVYEALFGPLIRRVSSVDGSIEVFPTTPSTYTSMTKSTSFKYNTNKYYWFLNGYLYFPNLSWDQIEVDGIFEGDLSSFIYKPSKDGKTPCIQRQDQIMPVPDFLFAEIEQNVMKDLGFTIQIPDNPENDSNSQLR